MYFTIRHAARRNSLTIVSVHDGGRMEDFLIVHAA
jgi:hypothetical protein